MLGVEDLGQISTNTGIGARDDIDLVCRLTYVHLRVWQCNNTLAEKTDTLTFPSKLGRSFSVKVGFGGNNCEKKLNRAVILDGQYDEC